MKPQAVKGTHDILPAQVPAWRQLEQRVRQTLERAGAGEIRPPVFEHTETFIKTAGESSDLVVQKEMYTFTDRGERSLTLRPEFTPGFLRAYIQQRLRPYHRLSELRPAAALPPEGERVALSPVQPHARGAAGMPVMRFR